jgi:2-polyprenyl-3-methyl-5-hydroxy-6-metoxy-1,4-benzoquinol methylase
MSMTTPHYVRDYRRWVSRLLDGQPDRDAAMARAVGGGDYHAVGEAERNILVALGLKSGDAVIDVGCGSGRLATALDRSGPSVHYLGTDVVPELVSYAQKRCATRETWRFSVVNGLTIPQPDASADFITFFSVFTHLARNECLAYLKEAKRVVKPDGKIVVSYLDLSAVPPSYLIRFLCSQAAYRIFGRGVKGVLSSETGMRKLADLAGMRVEFIDSSIGQSLGVFKISRAAPTRLSFIEQPWKDGAKRDGEAISGGPRSMPGRQRDLYRADGG